MYEGGSMAVADLVFDVPPILDFEASSLSDESYPISAGLVIEGKVHYWVIKPKPHWIDWSLPSQAIHRMKRSYIEEIGMPVGQVYTEMRQLLAPYSAIYSDAPEWEGMWLNRLGPFTQSVLHVHDLIPTNKIDSYEAALAKNFEVNQLIRHRADHDALAIAITVREFQSG